MMASRDGGWWGVLRSMLVAVIVMLPARATRLEAQRLEIRGAARALDVDLHPSLGVAVDSLRTVGHGVLVHDVQVGNGAEVRRGQLIKVHYVGLLSTGQRFAATDRVPFTFRVGDGAVIAGWEDGVIGMRVGGRRQLVVPPFLAYGRTGKGTIPPNATLVFDLTLVEVK